MRFHQRAALAGQEPLFMVQSGWTAPAELPSLEGVKRIALDIETHDPELKTRGPGFRWGARIVGLGLAIDGGARYYFPVGHAGGGNLDEGMVRGWAREELGSFRGEVVGANLGYDLDGLSTCWGVEFHADVKFHDVQIAEPLLDEWRDEFNLGALSRDYLGEGKDEQLLKEAAAAFGISGRDQIKSNLWRYPASVVGPYAEGDVDRPLRIFPLQEEKLRAEGLWELYDGVERRLIPILVKMRQRGVRIDVGRAERLRAEMVRRRTECVARLKDLAGPSAELMEAASLGPALEARGIPVRRTAKSGQYSVNKFMLEEFAGDPLIDAISAGRKVNTIITTFIDGQILGHAHKGRLHPTFNQLKGDDGGTIARFSGQHPNTQFLPARDAELAPMVRGIFLPEEGEIWESDDMSQIQYRLLVNCAVGKGAEEAREKYRTDPTTDYHELCAEILGADPKDKILRKRIKNTNFAKGFGAQVPKLAATFGCSIAEAEEFVRKYEAALPFTVETFDACARWGQKRGYVVTTLNRRQRFPHWGPARYNRKSHSAPLFKSREEAIEYYVRGQVKYRGWPVRTVERVNTYMALNRKLQGSEGDIMKLWIVRAEEAGLTAPSVLGPILITVHDENNTSVPQTAAGAEAAREFVRLGETVVQLKVPLRVQSHQGPDWGAAT